MPAIEIRSEFVRIARLFTKGVTGVTPPCAMNRPVLSDIYVEPNDAGEGVYVIASDGAAMCVQLDRKGEVDRPYVITNANAHRAIDFSCGGTINDHWLVGNPDSLKIVKKGKLHAKLSDVRLHPARYEGTDHEPGTVAYPKWRTVVPTQHDIASMQPGFPGYVDCAYLSTVARLYDDSMANCRTVKILSNGDINSPTLLQFPWRPEMFVVIAPLESQGSLPETSAINDVMSDGSDDL